MKWMWNVRKVFLMNFSGVQKISKLILAKCFLFEIFNGLSSKNLLHRLYHQSAFRITKEHTLKNKNTQILFHHRFTNVCYHFIYVVFSHDKVLSRGRKWMMWNKNIYSHCESYEAEVEEQEDNKMTYKMLESNGGKWRGEIGIKFKPLWVEDGCKVKVTQEIEFFLFWDVFLSVSNFCEIWESFL